MSDSDKNDLLAANTDRERKVKATLRQLEQTYGSELIEKSQPNPIVIQR